MNENNSFKNKKNCAINSIKNIECFLRNFTQIIKIKNIFNFFK